MMSKLFLGLMLMITVNNLLSQSFVFEKTYDYSAHDYIADFITTSDAGFAILGIKDNPSSSNFVLKLNGAGDSIWTNYITPWTHGNDIIQLQNSEYLIGGDNKTNAFLLKLNTEGDSIWSQSFMGDNESSVQDLFELGNGDLIINRNIYPPVLTKDLPTTKIYRLNPEGEEIWSSNIGEWAFEMLKLSNDEILLGGFDELSVNHNWVGFLNLYGEITNEVNSSFGWINGLTESSENKVYISFEDYGLAIGVIKTDLNANEIWTYNSIEYPVDEINDICELKPGFIATCGSINNSIFIKTLNYDGEVVSYYTIDKYAYQNANNMVSDGNFLTVAGVAKSESTNQDLYVFKISIDSLLSINQNEMQGVLHDCYKIYPNPVQDKLTILNTSAIPGFISIKLFDLLGKPIHNTRVFIENKISFDLPSLENGNYMVEISNDKMTFLKKIIILN